MKKPRQYNKRTWLNSNKSDSTSSVVAYDGKVTDMDTKQQVDYRFLEVSDCRNKIKIHQTSDDTKNDFTNKIKLLKDEIELFINYLENK